MGVVVSREDAEKVLERVRVVQLRSILAVLYLYIDTPPQEGHADGLVRPRRPRVYLGERDRKTDDRLDLFS